MCYEIASEEDKPVCPSSFFFAVYMYLHTCGHILEKNVTKEIFIQKQF